MNVLQEQLIRIETRSGIEAASLPDVYTALVADRVDSFPALRAHQAPAWHMFLVQLGAIAMHRAKLVSPPKDAEHWRNIISDLTVAEFRNDEPWTLVVEDQAKPGFLQPPVPAGLKLKSPIATPDELDMVITAKNHDLKQAVAARGQVDDWIFALVSLQTGDGFNGRGNYGIARMNGGSSSRVCVGLAPMATTSASGTSFRLGVRFRRDLLQLVERRSELLGKVPGIHRLAGRLSLTWTSKWEEGELLQLPDLDILFIEVCRRVRLIKCGEGIAAWTGNSRCRRINGEQFRGVVGDPWAPVNRAEAKSLTLGETGEFSYRTIIELISKDWELPLLATLGPRETDDAANWLLLAQAFARGNCKTGGFKERIIPLKGRIARELGLAEGELHELAGHQIGEIERADALLRNAIALGAAAGERDRDRDKVKERAYAKARTPRDRLEAEADRLFFPALWERFEAVEARDCARREAARKRFVLALIDKARTLLVEALHDLPCPSIRRPRAEARARSLFEDQLRSQKLGFPDYFTRHSDDKDAPDAAA